MSAACRAPTGLVRTSASPGAWGSHGLFFPPTDLAPCPRQHVGHAKAARGTHKHTRLGLDQKVSVYPWNARTLAVPLVAEEAVQLVHGACAARPPGKAFAFFALFLPQELPQNHVAHGHHRIQRGGGGACQFIGPMWIGLLMCLVSWKRASTFSRRPRMRACP